ncbi:hypothetical protein Vi05172_g10809 [Venturia inaequalis]|nr:hypothetical protein Vi05172_g10809 [Venturia inaequalis]
MRLQVLKVPLVGPYLLTPIPRPISHGFSQFQRHSKATIHRFSTTQKSLKLTQRNPPDS